LGVVLLGIGAFFAAVRWLPYPEPVSSARASTILTDRQGVQLAALVATDGKWRIPLSREQISPHLLNAIVAVEDSRFYKHHGVDWHSVAAAAWEDLRHLRVRRGASTITMQVQHLRSLGERSFANKILQAIHAEQAERRQTKIDILVEYVNRAPFGGNLTGAGAASLRYFGRPCRDLSLAEAALLAGLPQSPNRLRPDRYPQRARTRRDHVLDRMVECGFITKSQRDEAAHEPLDARWRDLPQDRANDTPSADGAMPTLLTLTTRHAGQTISTTLDATVQRHAMNAAREQLNILQPSGISAAAVVVLDNVTGECRAAVSLGANDIRIDLTRRPRSTGSTLKPFIYAAAFDAGVCGPGTVLADKQISWAGYEPSDYDREYRGPLTAAEALAESRNIPAMRVLARVGVQNAIGVMDAAGLHGLSRDPNRYGLTLAIGGAEATPFEIARAYSSLARGGKAISGTFVPADRKPQSMHARFARSDVCWQVLAALSEPARTRAICPEAVETHAAWKTGTSSGHRDAWCAAVTRKLTVVVWLGNTRGEGSSLLVGQEAAAPLALRLIAMSHPTDEPWPVVRESSATKVAWRDSSSEAGLIIRSPLPGQEIVLDSDIPAKKQRVALIAGRIPKGISQKLWWFVDDQEIGTSTEPEKLWWQPTPGDHEIRALNETGESAAVKVRVRQ
jgi:penicillin-binding protein 1C